MEYNEVIYLLSKNYEYDSIGNAIESSIKRKVFAMKKSVATKEFYNAVSTGITPLYEFQIRESEYNGEDELEYNGQTLSLTRTIAKAPYDLVLVASKKLSNVPIVEEETNV